MKSNVYKFAGRVVAVGKTEKLGRDPSKPFLKRTLVVDDAEDGDKFPNPVPFDATGERCAKLDGVSVGARVMVAFHAKGREWRDKAGNVRYFGSNWIMDVKGAEMANCEDIPEVPDMAQTVAADLPF